MAKKIISTGIRADVPTVNGRTYPRHLLEKAAKDFNGKIQEMRRAGKKLEGGWLDRDNIGKPSDPFFEIESVDLVGDELKATIDVSGNIDVVQEAMNSGRLIANPIMQVPGDQPMQGEIKKIDGIKTIGLSMTDSRKSPNSRFIQD